MSNTQKSKDKESDWKKIGPCLYRYRGGTYYALLKKRGKQIRQSLKTSDLELARRNLDKLRVKKQTADPILARRTLAQHRAIFEPLIGGAAQKVKDKKRYVGYLVEGWPKDAPEMIADILPSHVRAWLAPLRERYEAGTLNEIISVMRNFFDLAVDDGVIEVSPAVKIKYAKRPDKIRPTPTEEQFRAIVADIRAQKSNGHGSEDSADFVELAGTLGLGQAELSGIRRQDIDLEAGIIRVFRRKTSQQFTIPVFPDARAILERRLKAMPEDPEARLLPQKNCKAAIEGACRRLKFANFTPRALRRFHVTRSLRAGIDAPTIGNWQGHKDGGALVLKTYQAEVNLSHSLKMAAMLGPKPENVVELPTQQAAG